MNRAETRRPQSFCFSALSARTDYTHSRGVVAVIVAIATQRGASRTLRGAGCCVTKWGVDLVVGS